MISDRFVDDFFFELIFANQKMNKIIKVSEQLLPILTVVTVFQFFFFFYLI